MGGTFIDWWRSERGRKWAGELANIVLGVLVALALGAVATWVGWKLDVADARESIGDELGEIAGQAKLRERANRCMEQKFDRIGEILSDAAKSGRLAPTGPIGEPVTLTWSTGVWTSVIGADIGSHFGRGELDNLSGAYEMVTIINARSHDELDAWTRLYAIVGPGRAITPEEISALRQSLAEARLLNRQIVAASLRINQTITAFDLPANADTVRQYGTASLARYCSPIAAPDGRPYGQAPMADVVARIRANPITRDDIGMTKR